MVKILNNCSELENIFQAAAAWKRRPSKSLLLMGGHMSLGFPFDFYSLQELLSVMSFAWVSCNNSGLILS